MGLFRGEKMEEEQVLGRTQRLETSRRLEKEKEDWKLQFGLIIFSQGVLKNLRSPGVYLYTYTVVTAYIIINHLNSWWFTLDHIQYQFTTTTQLSVIYIHSYSVCK